MKKLNAFILAGLLSIAFTSDTYANVDINFQNDITVHCPTCCVYCTTQQ